MATKLVNIVKAFTLTLSTEAGLVCHKIAAGVQRLEADIANHWYTQAHSEPVPEGVSQSETAANAAPAADDSNSSKK